MGLKSFRLLLFLGAGIMIADFKHDGMMAWVRERLKILVKISDSWSAHDTSGVH